MSAQISGGAEPPSPTEPEEAAESRTSARTRRAIVGAAMETWAGDRNATLADICATAGIGRSTLHRYYADRAALLAAVSEECHRQFTLAAIRAHPDDGPGLEAILRLSEELLQLGSALSLIFSDNALVDPDTWSDAEESDRGLTGVILRGQQDGSIDPDLPADWVSLTLWMLLAGAWQHGLLGHSRRETVQLFARSLSGAIGARP